MKIKIINDESAKNNSSIKMDKFIGKIFNAQITKWGDVEVDFGEDLGILSVFEGEYEIIEK